MADNTYFFLKESGFVPEQELIVRKILSTSELGKRYHLIINGNKQSSVFQIDGNIITEGKRCDKLVLVENAKNDWAEIFVELKGVDVSSAIGQLKACLDNKVFKHITNKEISIIRKTKCSRFLKRNGYFCKTKWPFFIFFERYSNNV